MPTQAKREREGMEREILRDGMERPVLFDTYWSIREFADKAIADRNPHATPIRPSTLDRVRDGDDSDLPAVLDIAEAAVNAAPKLTESANFAASWDVTGAEVDVGSFLAGTPECMIDYPVMQSVSYGRVVTLVSSSDANCGMGDGGYRERGMVATALGMALVRLGYNVEMWCDIWGGDYSTPKYSECEIYQRMLVKSASDTLDPAHLMFAFGNRAMLTQLAFGTFDGFPSGVFHRTHSRESRGCAWDERSEWVTRDVYPEGTIFITGAPNGDVASMTEFVMNELRKAGLLAE
jgi:hypothetical protein